MSSRSFIYYKIWERGGERASETRQGDKAVAHCQEEACPTPPRPKQNTHTTHARIRAAITGRRLLYIKHTHTGAVHTNQNQKETNEEKKRAKRGGVVPQNLEQEETARCKPIVRVDITISIVGPITAGEERTGQERRERKRKKRRRQPSRGGGEGRPLIGIGTPESEESETQGKNTHTKKKTRHSKCTGPSAAVDPSALFSFFASCCIHPYMYSPRS